MENMEFEIMKNEIKENETNPSRIAKVKRFVKENKEVIIAGAIGVIATIATSIGISTIFSQNGGQKYVGTNNLQVTDLFTTEVLNGIHPGKRPYTSPTNPFEVSGGIVNMSANRHPSQKKIEQAIELGFTLGPNQTLRDSYIKNK